MIMVDAGGGFGEGQGSNFRSLGCFWVLPQALIALRLEMSRAQHPQGLDEA